MASAAVEKVLAAEKAADEMIRQAESRANEKIEAAKKTADEELSSARERAQAAVKEQQTETRRKSEDIYQGQRLLTEQKLRKMKEETATRIDAAVKACLDAVR